MESEHNESEHNESAQVESAQVESAQVKSAQVESAHVESILVESVQVDSGPETFISCQIYVDDSGQSFVVLDEEVMKCFLDNGLLISQPDEGGNVGVHEYHLNEIMEVERTPEDQIQRVNIVNQMKDVGDVISDTHEEVVFRGRKRKRNTEKHKNITRKRLINSGEEHVSVGGKIIPGKTCQPHSCKCKTCNVITEEQRQKLFKDFYSLSSWEAKTVYIANLVMVYTPKRPTKSDSRRKNSRAFYVTVVNNEGESNTLKVCKKFVMATLSINSARINGAVKRKISGVFSDERGHHIPHNKTPDSVIENVKLHINTYPKYISHYTRKRSKKLYLRNVHSVADMYREYLDWCKERNEIPVKEWIYSRVFNDDFNLSFHQPKLDTCKTCDILKMNIDVEIDDDKKALLEAQRDRHQDEAEQVREKLRKDTRDASVHQSNTLVFSFDLQKTKNTPHLNTNEVFYKRQLATYNCGIHDCGNNKGYFHMWHECVASRGSQEIASCLSTWIRNLWNRNEIPPRLIAYADSCGGQNRNITVCLFWLQVVQDLPVDTVDQIFMVSGHSFMPSDEDFGIDEREKRKYECIYVPGDWISVAERARKDGNKFDVKQMESNNFLNFKQLSRHIVNRKPIRLEKR